MKEEGSRTAALVPLKSHDRSILFHAVEGLTTLTTTVHSNLTTVTINETLKKASSLFVSQTRKSVSQEYTVGP